MFSPGIANARRRGSAVVRLHASFFLFAFTAAQSLLIAQTQPPASFIRAQSNLVVVDVTVTDQHRNPIRGLSPSDFTILEDGRAQTIKNFEPHSTDDAAHLTALPHLAPGAFTNRTVAPANGALNVLVLDKLNTPMKDQSFVVQQLKDYLKAMRPGTRVAIFGLTTQLRLLLGFTSDPALLMAFLDGKKGLPGASSLLNDAVAGDGPGSENAVSDQLADVLGNSPDGAQMLANLQQFEAEQQSFQLQLRARYTLDAFNELARFLERLPGRKNVLWFSGSFPISILPDGDLQNPFAVVADSEDEFRETTDLLARSQAAVYPIDARGLMVAPMTNASNDGSKYGRNPGAYGKDLGKFFQQTADEHGTMQQMAEATGGTAYVNTNGLKEAAASAIDAGSNYYTLSYSPTNTQWKGEYRKIEVKVEKPGLTLAYRRGYYADDADVPLRHGQPASSAAPALPAYNPLRAAMLHGGPDPTQIVFEATVQPLSKDVESAVATGNQANSKVAGPFRRYRVHYSVSPRDLTCATDADKVHHCQIEFLVYVYDADGLLENVQGNGVNAALDDNRFTAFLNNRFAYNQQISVPVKGESFLRVGVADMASERVGALELPVAAVAKLPVAEATAAGTPPEKQ
jgi:VWFA-related protein